MNRLSHEGVVRFACLDAGAAVERVRLGGRTVADCRARMTAAVALRHDMGASLGEIADALGSSTTGSVVGVLKRFENMNPEQRGEIRRVIDRRLHAGLGDDQIKKGAGPGAATPGPLAAARTLCNTPPTAGIV